MFGFRKKEEWWESSWNEIRKQYPIGRKFSYLGREMIVTQYDFDDDDVPCLECEYADNDGNLHEWRFLTSMAPILLEKP